MKLSHGLCPSTTDSRTERSLSEISSAAVCTCSSQREQQYCRGKPDLFWGPYCHTTGFQRCDTDISGSCTFSNWHSQASVSSHMPNHRALAAIKIIRRKSKFTVTQYFFWRLYTCSLKPGSLWLTSQNYISTTQQLSTEGREDSAVIWTRKSSCFTCRCVFVPRWQLSGYGTTGQPCSQPRSRAGLGCPALLSCQHILIRSQIWSTSKSTQITELQ